MCTLSRFFSLKNAVVPDAVTSPTTRTLLLIFSNLQLRLPLRFLHMSDPLSHSNVSHDALSLPQIIARDDDAALKQACQQIILLPSSHYSREFLSPILASAVSAGAIRIAGFALLHGADPNYRLAENSGATLLHIAASQRDEAMVSGACL
jgi:hypothetical protein